MAFFWIKMSDVIKVKNWAKHQHFKDRKPPWIKLYRDILDDLDWHHLNGDDAKTLVMLWLIASENSGALPDSATLAFRLRKSVSEIETQLSRLQNWLISERYQVDITLSQNISATELINTVADIEVPLRDRDRDRDREESMSPDKLVTCPTQSVVDLYHSILPELPSVRLMSNGRQKAISTFWRWVLSSKRSDGERRAQTAEQALEWIGSYFTRTRDNEFLMGNTSKNEEHGKWQCDLDFLLTEKGKKHVIEKTRDVE